MKVADQIWRVRIAFGLLGMRRGEMLNVCRSDINLSSCHPHILLCPKKRSKDTWPWELKDHAARYVALPEKMFFNDIVVRLHDDIKSLMDNYWPYICLEQRYFLKLIKWQRDGKPEGSNPFEKDVLDPTGNFQRMFRSLQKRAGINPTKRYHELRAAFATKMIEGYGLNRAADALGHSNVQTTRKYNRKSEMSLVADMGNIAEKCYQSNVP
jgi:integrase